MPENKKLSPEFVAFISGIAKFIDETDAKKAGERIERITPPAFKPGQPKDREENYEV